MTLEATLHNISINPSSMNGPADGEIFESNHLDEIADIWSKLIRNLAKVGKTYHHLCAQLLNPSPEELQNFLVNCEKTLTAVCITSSTWMTSWPMMLGIISSSGYPRYIPTTVELCRASFADIIDKLKADLAFFKDDLWNREMLKVIYRPMGNTPHPGPGQGASTPNPLDASMGGPGSTTPRGNSMGYSSATPPGLHQPHHLGTLLCHHQGLPLLAHLEAHWCHPCDQYLDQGLLQLETNLNLNPNLSHSLNHSLSPSWH